MAEIAADAVPIQRQSNGGADATTINGDVKSVVAPPPPPPTTKKSKSRSSREAAAIKRRCVSTACIACRRRKSKCDGNTPSCAACASVYGTECVYDPSSDHRRKGVYKEKVDSLATRGSTLQTLVQAILNAAEDDVPGLVHQIRTCESLDDVADSILRQEQGLEDEEDDVDDTRPTLPTFETTLSGKMGELRLENGSVRFLGGTSNLIYLEPNDGEEGVMGQEAYQQQDEPLLSWTTVTNDTEVIVHLINLYFTWHYPYFTTLSKSLFYRDFLLGKPSGTPKRTVYCSSLLVNAMLALGCHFTNSPVGCADPNDPATKGDAFFAEAKRLIVENDEYAKPKLTTIQALCLMSVREAGCGREASGWVYSGMGFRMAQDMGLNLDSGGMTNSKDGMDEQEIDARRITFWGCFLFDKCWSNYLGRLPQLPVSNITTPKFDVFPDEDADIWSPYAENGISQLHAQPSRTRTVALQITRLCEISNDLLLFFYHPHHLEKSVGRSQELKKLSELQTRLEAWRKELPKELEAKEGQLPNVLLMHMFFHLLYIHLFRPFLKYSPSTSPLPAHVSPRKVCIQAASSISKLMRLYKRTYGLRQICNTAVYIMHSACTIHLLNLPDKTAKRDIIHSVKHLEEIAEDWLCARRTLSIISVLAKKWKSELPEEASTVLARTDAKFGYFGTSDVPSPRTDIVLTPPSLTTSPRAPQRAQQTPVTPHIQTPPIKSTPKYALHEAPPAASNRPANPPARLSPQLEYMHSRNPAQAPRQTDSLGTINLPNEQLLSSVPYQTPLSNNTTSKMILEQRRSLVESRTASTTMTRPVSPNTILGGVDTMVESQDWWLRDQANLAVGFDNWMGTENAMDVNPAGGGGNNNSRLNGASDLMTGMGTQFYMPPTGNTGSNGGALDGDWSVYN